MRVNHGPQLRVQQKAPPADNPYAAKESMKDECDINRIMRKYENEGAPPPMARGEARYGDFSNVTDYLGALNQVNQAKYAFSQLPAKVRRRFGNDPAELIFFLQDESNREEAVDLGLVEPPEEQLEIPGTETPVAPATAPVAPVTPAEPTEP